MTNLLKELYQNKLKYNASYYTIKERGTQSEYMIYFIGCNEFVITSNYYGCVALGVRSYDWDKEEANYIYQETKNEPRASTLERLMTEYERKRLQTKAIIKIERTSPNYEIK